MEIIDQEILNFGDLFWGFGYYLFCSIDDNEIFREKKMRKNFLGALFPKSKSKRRSHKKHLELVSVLLNQNSVFLRPESKTVDKPVLNNTTNTTQIKRRRRHHVPHLNQYFLNAHWRTLFMDPKYSFSPIFEKKINQKTVHRLPPKKRSKKFSPQRVSHPDRTIGILGFKIHKILQNEPKTREQIENETQFPRQRVSLVLSVYKSLKMIIEDQSTGYFHWNYEQSVNFPKTTNYFSELIKAKKTKELLKNRLITLSKRFMEKAEQKNKLTQQTKKQLNTVFNQLSNQQTQNTNTKINTNKEQPEENNNESKVTVPSKSEIQELLASLRQKRRHLQRLRIHTQNVLDGNNSNNKHYCGNTAIIEEKEVEMVTLGKSVTVNKKQRKKIQKQKTKKQQEIPFKRRRSKRRLQQMGKNTSYLTNTNTDTDVSQYEQPKTPIFDQLQVQSPKMETLPSSPVSLFLENNRQDMIETDTSSDDDDENQQNKNCMQITDTREDHNKTTFTQEEILFRGRTKKETEAVQAILQLRPVIFNEPAHNNSFNLQQQQQQNNINVSHQKISTFMSLLQNTSFNTLLSYPNNFLHTSESQKN
ncbi:hypothetical protein M0812_18026 [Anaeramoeba flamelloides]|uniref:Uncharacterized protein n=1 Tax=Anaeramoeba flamelloides TaxID=1746091 RepID=A0AAV7Z1K2_9EUKA|nr:hypothetical protein M0812_18026 [Anaeramoeba flamelloides]